jgi:4-hydroxy-3-methylbut-2-en-1-yl diphosphate reductase
VTRAVVCTPLLVERLALAGALPNVDVVRTGRGLRRSRSAADRLGDRYDACLVAGVGGGLAATVQPGDIVVATEVRSNAGLVRGVPSAPLLAAALRERGLPVHLGPIHSADSIVTDLAGSGLAETGALVVDTESSAFGELGSDGAFAVLRAVVDTPEHPLFGLGTLRRGVRALRALRAAAPVIRQWAVAVETSDAADDVEFGQSRKGI